MNLRFFLPHARLLGIALLFGSLAPANAVPVGLPAPPIARTPRQLQSPRVAQLQSKISRAQIFSAYDELSQIYTREGLFDDAARLERAQAPLYRRRRLEDAAIIHELRAANLQNELQLFRDVPTSAQNAGKLFTSAPLEPVLGCYLGAFIDRDESLGARFFDENGQFHRSPEQFLAATGALPGSLFMYLRYGQKFPSLWVSRLKAAGVVPHIAWEPTDLRLVNDDAYLRSFAEAARAADWPVFIRFASEMNGRWTPYHGNPALYRQKFKLVHRVLHARAPRLATIWCVNNPPLGNALDYYPGDDGCDWVGVNFYAVPYHENRRDRPAFDENPLALLDPIYRRFAARKPIAVCEFAASHQSVVDGKPIPDFAIEKLSLLYGALPLRYPRVKMVNWFDMNTLGLKLPGKTLNNYLLTANPQVLGAWRRATATPHYLTRYASLGQPLPPVARPLSGQLRGQNRIRIWAKNYLTRPRLFVALDDKIIFRAQNSGAHAFDLDVSKLRPGRHSLTAYLYDARGRFQRATTAVFSVR
ncbi:MAG TPA: glycosyl hydrolase [Abditibacterium sp.]